MKPLQTTVFVLWITLLAVNFAFAASITPGAYEAPYGRTTLTIMLGEDGNGYFVGETHNRVEWKQSGSELILKIYEEEGGSDFSTFKAKVLSPDSFDFDGLKYTRADN